MTDRADNLPRFFAEKLSEADGELTLDDNEAHHAAHVLRLGEGQAVELFDGRGHAAAGVITACKKRQVRLRLTGTVQTHLPPAPALHLAFAVPKGQRLDWLLEKATELGAASLEPIQFARSVAGGKGLSAHKLDRWAARCVAAAKQCGLNHLPEIRPACGLGDFLAALPAGRWLLGDGRAGTPPLAEALAAEPAPDALGFVVGPEGGLNDREHQAVCQAGLRPVRLGPGVLRVETAAVALLAGCRALTDSTQPR